MVSSANILVHYIEKQNVSRTLPIWLNVAYFNRLELPEKKTHIFQDGGQKKEHRSPQYLGETLGSASQLHSRTWE
jgi:hypothetical protein